VPARTVELLSRPGCHLCDDARRLVERVAAETGASWTETDVDQVPALRAEFGDLVPVVRVDGKELGHWRIDEAKLRRALTRRRG
jgi:glutaredoxin